MQENFLTQKARDKNLLIGDRKAKFFHSKINRSKRRLHIHAIYNANIALTTTDHAEIAQTLLETWGKTMSGWQWTLDRTIPSFFPKVITEDENHLLLPHLPSPHPPTPTEEEIYSIVQTLNSWKAGQIGLNGEFHISACLMQKTWLSSSNHFGPGKLACPHQPHSYHPYPKTRQLLSPGSNTTVEILTY